MIKEILIKSFESDEDLNLKNLFQEKLKATGFSKTQFERLANIQRRSLDNILDNTSKHTDIINLLKVGEFLDLDVDKTLNCYFRHRPNHEIKELQNAMETTFLHKYFDLRTLEKIGFLDRKLELEKIKDRICNFFQLQSIYDYEDELNNVLYSRTRRNFSNKMRDFWIKSSYKYFEFINNPNPYVRSELKKLIPKIKPYTQNIEYGFFTVVRALYYVGVTVIFQPMLPKTQIRGATFLVNEKPCIVITDLNKRYSTIWFALVHELYHVLFDLDELTNLKYHLTGEPDLFLMQEDKANKFAEDYFVSEDKMKYVEPLINNPLIVSKCAKSWQVHPSLIYSFYQYKQEKLGKNYWGAFNEFFPDVKLAIKKLNVMQWDIENIKVAANRIKEIFKL